MHDTQELDQHLKETEWFIEQHRAQAVATNTGYSDEEPTFNGFGPKSPCNDNALDMADEEALLVEYLARYCIARGSIPAIPLKGFWWSKTRCLGLKSGDLSGFRKVIGHLRRHIDAVFETEGIAEHLELMDRARGYSKRMFPNEDTDWLTMEEAIKFTDKDESTIYKWLKAGGIPTLDDRWGLMISKVHLQTKMALIYGSKLTAMQRARDANSKNA